MRIIILLLSLLLLQSCAYTFKTGYQKVSIEDIRLKAKRVFVDLKVIVNGKMITLDEDIKSKIFKDHPRRCIQPYGSWWPKQFACQFFKAITESKYFGKVEMLPKKLSSQNVPVLRMNITIEDKLSTFDKVHLTVNLLTLTIVPYWEVYKYNITAEYFDHTGMMINKVSVSEEMTQVLSILLLPVAPFVDKFDVATTKLNYGLMDNVLIKLFK